MEKEQEILEKSFDWMGLVTILKWPILVFILVLMVILFFRKQIVYLFDNIKEIKFRKMSITTNDQNILNKNDLETMSFIDKSYDFYSPEVIEKFSAIVKDHMNLKSLISPNQKIERLEKYSTILQVTHHFELLYSLIFGSQIMILQELNTLKPATRESVKPHYNNAKKANIKYYKGYTYESYLNFMLSCSLIKINNQDNWNNDIRITTLGKDFLRYLTETNKDVNKLL